MTTSSSHWEGWVPLGDTGLTVWLTGTGSTIEQMSVDARAPDGPQPPDNPISADVIEALAIWPQAGGGPDWTRHPVFSSHGTPFQRSVWSALCAVEPGETTSYGELARRIDRPRSARAVGQAVGANPWAPLVPCHRVLTSDGALGGYAGGVAIKSALLAAEGTRLD